MTVEEMVQEELKLAKKIEISYKSMFLKFTFKEVFKMPKEFRKQFRAGGSLVLLKKYFSGYYEIYYSDYRYIIEPVGANDLGQAKAKFIEAVKEEIALKSI